MNIGIDVNCIIFDRSGFGRYTYNMVKNILLFDQKNHYFLYANFLRHGKARKKIINELVNLSPKTNVTVKISRLPARWKEFLFGLPISVDWLYRDALDVYWSPHFAGIPKRGLPKKIVSIHDLVFMRFPEHRGGKLSNFYLRRTKQAIDRCEQIVAVSKTTQRDLETMLNVDSKKIKVIYEGVDEAFKPNANTKECDEHLHKYFPSRTNYFLCVGTLEPRKNLITALKAYSLLPNKLKANYKLVFVGARGWQMEKFQAAIRNYNLNDSVIMTGFVADEDLPYIYNRALLLVFPSLYEGFGLPVLEALASGTAVVASNTAAVGEIAGSAAILIDPSDEKKFAAEMRRLTESPAYLRRLKEKGIKRAKHFKWSKAARSMITLFEKVGK